MKHIPFISLFSTCFLLLACGLALGQGPDLHTYQFNPAPPKPVDSELLVKVGDPLPPFDLPTIDSERIRLEEYLGRKNVVLSFIPAAWTPVCSGQWPGYNIVQDIFEEHDAVLIGISVDNLPTLSAWVEAMGGLWFTVASDFWPHGGYATQLGILRSEGVTERALFLADKQGIIRYIDVHDINSRPDLGELVQALSLLE